MLTMLGVGFSIYLFPGSTRSIGTFYYQRSQLNMSFLSLHYQAISCGDIYSQGQATDHALVQDSVSSADSLETVYIFAAVADASSDFSPAARCKPVSLQNPGEGRALRRDVSANPPLRGEILKDYTTRLRSGAGAGFRRRLDHRAKAIFTT